LFTHYKIDFAELRTKNLNGQRWYETPDGTFYPSITTVLGVKKKPHLIRWQQSLGPERANKEVERTKARGDAVHSMVENYLQNNPEPTKDHDPAHIRCFNQVKLVLHKVDNIRAQEVPLFSDYFSVAGRVDCIAEYNGILSVIDFKSSNGNKTEEMIEDYFLQETFYALAFTEMTGQEVKQIVTLMAVERGIAPLVFKKAITPYIVPLKKRIDEFYAAA
jgi:ATP-dependent exoDNAse (exonuclease V) beta subunit